jgi:signal transduction histidine kinase
LGLAVSHKIVQDHGGRIEVESIEHKETTFYINLPMNK